MISLFIAIGLALTEVSLWMSLLSLFFLSWKFLHEKKGWPLLSKNIVNFIGFLIFVVVYIQYRTWIGQEESITILLGLASLTILNFDSQRDYLFLILLGFLILVMKSFFSFDLVWLIPSVLGYFGFWLALMSLTGSTMNRYRFLFWTTLKSVPVMALLFVFFPRLVLFQTERVQQKTARSGFSEELNPGRFSEVVMQNELVFRAEFFSEDQPKISEMYWRGVVLTESEGLIWKKSTQDRKVKRSDFKTETVNPGLIRDYKIVLEPLQLRTVFLLDQPISLKAQASPLKPFLVEEWESKIYRLSQPETQPIQYEARAIVSGHHVDNPSDPVDQSRYLQIPQLPPRTQRWVNKIKEKQLSEYFRLQELQSFFLDPQFAYTLSPDVYQNNLDDFLFVRKKGYCEHFAAAYATLARALGIPARVVIGFQGGVFNSIGQFWSVSQKEAHAWVELGIKNSWQRFDPTSLVSPLRLTMGGTDFFSLSEEEQQQYAKNPNWKNANFIFVLWRKTSAVFENINYNWTIFLLNYDMQTQLNILNQLRSNSFVLLLFVLMVSFVVVYYWKRKKVKKSLPANHLLTRLTAEIQDHCKSINISLELSDSVQHMLNKIAVQYPDWQSLSADYFKLYQKVVFQEKSINQNDVVIFEKRWREFFKKVKADSKV